MIKKYSDLCELGVSFENTGRKGLGHFKQNPTIPVFPAWSAGIQVDMDVSGGILRIWMPAIHAGMTKLSIFMFCGRA